MTKGELRDVAEIHYTCLNDSFLSSLGINFLIALYGELINSQYGVCYIYKENSKVVGFITGTTNTNQLFKELILKSWRKFTPTVLKQAIVRPKIFLNAMQTIFYPTKAKVGTDAELLSIVVLHEYRRKRIGNKLVEKLITYFKNNKVDRLKVIVDKGNAPANKFYQNRGFEFARIVRMYGKEMNFYVHDL